MQDTLNQQVLSKAKDTLLAVSHALPRHSWLSQELADAEAVKQRGYYLPDEDERLRSVFAKYLSLRQALYSVLSDTRPLLRFEKSEEQIKAFCVAFAAASILFRSGRYLLDTAAKHKVIWTKLDEAESRYGIPRKSFTQVYKSLTSPRNLWSYCEAWRFYDENREDMKRLGAHQGWSKVLGLIEQEEPFMQTQRREYLRRRLSYRVFSFLRRHRSGYRKTMFHLFRIGGSVVAELKQPGVKAAGEGKRILEKHYDAVLEAARAGDVFITRHDDALSNVFLPGYWPHAALYIASSEERKTEGLCLEPEKSTPAFFEAKKDGVKCRNAKETLAVDSVVILRPVFSKNEIGNVLNKASSHIGKLYDFTFDFRQADRLACTALVYRSYHGAEGKEFELVEQAGRFALSAENLMDQLIGKFGFEVVAVFGAEDSGCLMGNEAKDFLRQSYKSNGW